MHRVIQWAWAIVAVVAIGGQAARANVVTVEDWGINGSGQLGNGTTNPSNAPVAVTGISNGVNAVATGYHYSLAIVNGGLFAWGTNTNGELGNGVPGDSSTPVAVSNLSAGVTAIAGGYTFAMAVQNGGVFAWGSNSTGQLGNGTNNNSSTPVAVSNLTSGVTAIAGGGGYGMAIQNGAAYAWGFNSSGQLGNGTTNTALSPTAVLNLTSGVTAIATAESHSLAIQNGAVYAWGSNNSGQLGNGTTGSFNATPTKITASGLDSGVTAIAAGGVNIVGAFSLAVKDGNVYAWGANNSGQLGDGTNTGHATPELIDAAQLNNIVAVAAGDGDSFALSASGQLWAWGENRNGQLGLGNSTSFNTPQLVPIPIGFAGFSSIDADAEGGNGIATLIVPEPTSLSLLALGGAALLTRRRCRTF